MLTVRGSVPFPAATNVDGFSGSVTRPASIRFASRTFFERCTRNIEGMYCATRPSRRLPSASVLFGKGEALPL